MAVQTAWVVLSAALRSKCLSLAKSLSMGFRSGDYFGRKKSLAPADRMASRIDLPLKSDPIGQGPLGQEDTTRPVVQAGSARKRFRAWRQITNSMPGVLIGSEAIRCAARLDVHAERG